MSSTRAYDDACAQRYQESLQSGAAEYTFNRGYWMREGRKRCYPGGLGQVCSTYGPMDNTTYGRQVTRDSYLSGRGQALSNCPECQVRWLPEELFEPVANSEGALPQSDDLTPQTRQPKACSTAAEVDTTAYAFMPRYYNDDTSSLLVQFGADSKSLDRANDNSGNAARRARQQGKTSYGYYPTCPPRAQ